MRAAKNILLVGENDFTLSPLRFMLSHSTPTLNSHFGRCYLVVTANSVQEALDTLSESQFDLMLCQCPIAYLDHLLKRAKEINCYIPTMVLFDKASEVGVCFADAVLCKPPNAELLERIRIMIQRKRGPRKGWMKGVAPERPVVREMEVVA
jgi:DNA-binding response OmpR family regulator